MPALTRLFIKTALVYLVLALAVGIVRTLAGVNSSPAIFAYLTPVYLHLFMVGWVTEMIIGVGYWMFPKYTAGRPRGSDAMAWAVYVLLNTGLILRVAAEPMNSLQPGEVWGWLLAVSAVLQWAAGMIFVANTWPRLRER